MHIHIHVYLKLKLEYRLRCKDLISSPVALIQHFKLYLRFNKVSFFSGGGLSRVL